MSVATVPVGLHLGAAHHHATADELAVVIEGTATLVVGGQTNQLNPHVALWTPRGIQHAVQFSSDSLICPIRFTQKCVALAGHDVTELTINAAVRRVALHEVQRSVAERFRPAQPKEQLLQTLPTLPRNELRVTVPQQTAARAVALSLLADPADARRLDDWSDELAVSARTIRRAFIAQSGVTFEQWRLRLRIRRALSLLAGGRSTESALRLCGFRGRSVFLSTLEREMVQAPRLSL